MDIDQLRAMGVVSSNPLVRREFKISYHPLLPEKEWADPAVPERSQDKVDGTIDVWLRKPTASDQLAIHKAIADGRDAMFVLLHRCVFKQDGSRVFPTEEDAVGLDLSVFSELVVELNRIAGDLRKKSLPRTKSGANSLSPSADEASLSGKT